MDYSDLIKQFNKNEKELIKQEYARELLTKSIESKTNEFELLKINKEKNNQAALFLKSKAADTRKTSCEVIDDIVTNAIQPIYGEDYGFSFQSNEKAIEKGLKSSFNLIPTISSQLGNSILSTSIKDSRGGGLSEVMSVLLRLAFLSLNGYNGLVILDESWAAVSADEKMDSLISFFDGYVKESGIQVLLITHRTEMFGKIADNILKVKKENGSAKVYPATYEEVLEEYAEKIRNSN
jgi:hypothetical protein